MLRDTASFTVEAQYSMSLFQLGHLDSPCQSGSEEIRESKQSVGSYNAFPKIIKFHTA